MSKDTLGEFELLGAAIDFYRTTRALPDTDEIPNGGAYSFTLSPLDVANIRVFLERALTDPRVAAETYPFDRPRLSSARCSRFCWPLPATYSGSPLKRFSKSRWANPRTDSPMIRPKASRWFAGAPISVNVAETV